jgi:hypothetical protein
VRIVNVTYTVYSVEPRYFGGVCTTLDAEFDTHRRPKGGVVD